MSFLIEHDKPWSLSTLWTALAAQIPETHPGLELLDLIPEDRAELRATHYLKEAFKQSVLWRAPSAFSQRTLELFDNMGGDFSDPRLEIRIQLATLRDHPRNAHRFSTPPFARSLFPDVTRSGRSMSTMLAKRKATQFGYCYGGACGPTFHWRKP